MAVGNGGEDNSEGQQGTQEDRSDNEAARGRPGVEEGRTIFCPTPQDPGDKGRSAFNGSSQQPWSLVSNGGGPLSVPEFSVGRT